MPSRASGHCVGVRFRTAAIIANDGGQTALGYLDLIDVEAIKANVEFGHAGPNLPMPVGIRVALDAQQRTLSLLEPAVRPHATTGGAQVVSMC